MELILDVVNSFWFQSIFKLILGFVLAGIIGLERSSWNKPAGFRTHSLLGISSVLMMLCGEYMAQKYNNLIDPSRISAQLLSGIGFIGAGTILRDGFNVKGLTTAAALLSVTCIGLSIGAGFYLGGIVTTFIVYVILSYSYKLSDKLEHFTMMTLKIEISQNTNEVLSSIEKLLSKYHVEIKQIKRPDKDDDDNGSETVIISGQYDRVGFNKNELLHNITSLKNVKELVEE